jgi:hypothetical protein
MSDNRWAQRLVTWLAMVLVLSLVRVLGNLLALQSVTWLETVLDQKWAQPLDLEWDCVLESASVQPLGNP